MSNSDKVMYEQYTQYQYKYVQFIAAIILE